MDRDFSTCICFTALCFINRYTRDNFIFVTLGHYFDHQVTYCSIVYSHRGFELCRTECPYTKYSLVIVHFLSPSWWEDKEDVFSSTYHIVFVEAILYFKAPFHALDGWDLQRYILRMVECNSPPLWADEGWNGKGQRNKNHRKVMGS